MHQRARDLVDDTALTGCAVEHLAQIGFQMGFEAEMHALRRSPTVQAPTSAAPPATQTPEAPSVSAPDRVADPAPPASEVPADEASCARVMQQAFPDPAYSRVDVKTAPRALAACCIQKVVAQRYDPNCCNYLFGAGALDPADPSKAQAVRACSPWGPPMPPAMARAARQAGRTARPGRRR